MALGRTWCSCGLPIVAPPPRTFELLKWAIRAHNDSEHHRRWADALEVPSFPVAVSYNQPAGDSSQTAGARARATLPRPAGGL